MTPQEIKSALSEISKSIGPRAEVSMHIGHEYAVGEEIYVGVYPFGICNSSKGHLSVRSSTFEGAIEGIRAAWAKHADEHRVQTTRSMALAIIRITTEIGDCTDAALRQDFDAGEIARWGDDACTMADEMAGKGPFKIKRKRGANAA